MQPYSKLLVVLPCHSLEDFPIHYRGDDAANLLAHWTALWHPALIAACGRKPEWHQADNPDPVCGEFDDEFSDEPRPETQSAEQTPPPFLAIIPAVSQSMLDYDLVSNFRARNGLVIDDQSSRAEIIRLAIEANEPTARLAAQVDPDLALDFLALGYGFLQTQIMTRQLRYSSNLDEAHFTETVVEAAKHATAGQHEKAKESLTRCFDLLLDEKNNYYPVQPELVDLVLTAPTKLAAGLDRQLTAKHAFNVLLTGNACQRLASKHPETLAKLKSQVAAEQVTIIGGLQDELPEPLVSSEATVHQLQLGRATVAEHFDVEPTVFMRRRFGLTASLPSILEQFGFVGAVHSTLDDGTFPRGSSCNIRWTGDDDRSILAMGELPIDASDAGSFLGLGVRLGEAIDSAHVAAAVLVHWPGETCESFEDLLRITGYGPLFGSFNGLNDYFDSVYDPGYGETFTADEYRSPFLKQAIAKRVVDPISRFTKYWTRFYRLMACRALLTQACARSELVTGTVKTWIADCESLQSDLESELNQSNSNDSNTESRLVALEQSIKSHLSAGESQNNGNSGAIELLNLTTHRRRVHLRTSSNSSGTLKSQPPVVVCDSDSKGTSWIVDIPAMGATVLDLDSPQSKDLLKSDPSMGEELILRNEFFELQVDSKTGGVRSIQLYEKRINLASQQLAMRIPGKRDSHDKPLTQARYTQMVADQISLDMESRLAGKIVSVGRLLDGESTVAEFKQTIRVVRGKPLIEFDVEVNPVVELDNSINHYVCSRLAWKNETSRIVVNACESRQEVNTDWFHATNYLEVVQDSHRLVMLTGGLPYHRRTSRRMVDSLLIVGKESARRFCFALGVDVGYSMSAAAERLTPVPELTRVSQPSVSQDSTRELNSSSWLFHLSAKNILVTWWEPTFDEQGRWSGVQIRMRETEGRSGSLAIRCPLKIASADQVKLGGEFIQSVDHLADDDPSRLRVEFGRFEYFQLLIRWKL